mmetsp:Transcript_37012/g.98336  ORF Transcript_37012/g.98336 Transcript_37012/m.98336 type:complete len:369 (-) Transcript_37012:820-1926(-)
MCSSVAKDSFALSRSATALPKSTNLQIPRSTGISVRGSGRFSTSDLLLPTTEVLIFRINFCAPSTKLPRRPEPLIRRRLRLCPAVVCMALSWSEATFPDTELENSVGKAASLTSADVCCDVGLCEVEESGADDCTRSLSLREDKKSRAVQSGRGPVFRPRGVAEGRSVAAWLETDSILLVSGKRRDELAPSSESPLFDRPSCPAVPDSASLEFPLAASSASTNALHADAHCSKSTAPLQCSGSFTEFEQVREGLLSPFRQLATPQSGCECKHVTAPPFDVDSPKGSSSLRLLESQPRRPFLKGHRSECASDVLGAPALAAGGSCPVVFRFSGQLHFAEAEFEMLDHSLPGLSSGSLAVTALKNFFKQL